MSFLDWVADWCEENIPGIGWAIAWVVRRIQDGVESAYGWVASWTRWFIDAFKPWVESWINWLYNAYDSLTKEISDRLKPLVEAIDRTVDGIKEWYDSVRDELNKFVANPLDYIEKHLPNWISEGISSAISKVKEALSWITTKGAELTRWIQNASSWFSEQLENAKQTLLSWIEPLIKPLSEWVTSFKQNFMEFLENPLSWLEKNLPPWVKELPIKLLGLSEEYNAYRIALKPVIKGIHKLLKELLLPFIEGLIAWFLWSLFHDLFTLEYDPETKEVKGEPKNPVTKIFLELIEVEKPEYEYDVRDEEVEQL